MSLSKIKEKLRKIKEIRAPWIPFLWRPRFTYSIPKPDFAEKRTREIAFFLFVLIASLLFGGLIYSTVELPPPLVTVRERPGFIYPGTGGQTTTEVFIVSVIFILGSIGIYLIRRSSTDLIKKQDVDVELYAGYALILLMILSILVVYIQKAQIF